MSVRSLPHFSHAPIGKTTHSKGFSYQSVNYITRNEACTAMLAENMPSDRSGARPYFEREARKPGVPDNARVADTLIIALPIELDRGQRHDAIHGFLQTIGHGRIAWLAAFHDKGEDEHNPHCHVIFRDADVETGRKVVGTTTGAKDVREAQEKGWRVPPRMTTKDLRIAWCEHLNTEMERHGLEARFDHRSLKSQGIDRDAGIHVGPKASAMAAKGKEVASRDLKRGDAAIVYSLLDDGSRADHNARIAERNRQRQNFGSAPATESGRADPMRERHAAERKSIYAEQAEDRVALRKAQSVQKLAHQRWARTLDAAARKRAFDATAEKFAPRWSKLRKSKGAGSRADAVKTLKAEQKAAYAKAMAKQLVVARPIKAEAWQRLKQVQEAERSELKQRHIEETTSLSRQHVAERRAAQPRDDRSSVGRNPAWQSGDTPRPIAPAEFVERAKVAENSRTEIRADLDASRAVNQRRALEPAAYSPIPSRVGQRVGADDGSDRSQRSVRQELADDTNGGHPER